MPTKKVAVVEAAPKKTATKTAVKKTTKTAAKKTVTKSTGKALVYAQSATSFWVADGQILNSLVALRDVLSTMDKEVYAQHVNAEKNDFAAWVGAVLDDKTCARELKTAKTPAAAKTIVSKTLKRYSL